MFSSEKWKSVSKKLPIHIKLPVLLSGLFGTLLNCFISSLGGTIIYQRIINAGYTVFSAKFFSLAFTLFAVQLLNFGMNITAHFIMDRLHKKDQND